MSSRRVRRYALRLLPLVPVVCALALVFLWLRGRSTPVQVPLTEDVRRVRVIAAPSVSFVPRVVGYGLAEPPRIWRAMAEVKGTVVEVHPSLSSGEIIAGGSVLLRLDPVDYEFAVARLRAGMAETQARLAELDAEAENKQASLAIETASLELARTSLARLRTLQDARAVPADQVDREERTVLQQRQAIQQIESVLNLVPARRAALEAALAVQAANLGQAQKDLERTVIRAPFACRLGEVRIQEGQFLAAGQTIFEAHGTDSIEVEAVFHPEHLRNLVSPEKRQALQPGLTMETLRSVLDVDVCIRLRSGSWEATWPARFERIRETVNPRTRAIHAVASVADPYAQVIPGERPVLVRGMHCEMELRGAARPGSVVLPYSAVREGAVLLVDETGRLRSRPVVVSAAQGDLVLLEAGVVAGDTVVVSDPVPLMEGMKVDLLEDADLLQRLVLAAEGGESPQ